jgi:hypothetical protein
MELPRAPRSPKKRLSPIHRCDAFTRTAQQGDAPLRRIADIKSTDLRRNEEAPFPQGLEALFERVLRKKHVFMTGPGHKSRKPGLGADLIDFII